MLTNTSAIFQQAAHTTYQLLYPNNHAKKPISKKVWSIGFYPSLFLIHDDLQFWGS